MSFPHSFTIFLTCSGQLEALAVSGWNLNLVFSNICVWYLALNNKNLYNWPKAKNRLCLWNTFSLENWWEKKFSTTLLRSSCHCNKFVIFVVNLAWQIAPTLNCSITGYQIFWWWWTNSCWWFISSVFQIHEIIEVFMTNPKYLGKNALFGLS